MELGIHKNNETARKLGLYKFAHMPTPSVYTAWLEAFA